MKNILYRITVILILIPQISISQINDYNSIEKTIDSIGLKMKQQFKIPGLAIGLIMNNNVVYSKGFGVQSIDKNTTVNSKSLFHMASVSKPFVATAIMQLVEKGIIQLDSSVIKYLPYFKMADERYKDITLRHILTHTSGIPDVEDYEWDSPQYDKGAAKRYTKSFEKLELDFAPGKKFGYSNASFDLMADLIANVTGISFEEYIKNNILIPCGMTQSNFLRKEINPSLATSPHIYNTSYNIVESNVYPYNRIHAPSSTLHSNVEDMLKWGKMNLNKGTINSNQIVDSMTFNLLITPQVKYYGGYICLGWSKQNYYNKILIEHSGGDVGYSTYFGFFPSMSVAIVVMANCDYVAASSIAYSIWDKVLFNKDMIYWKIPIHYELNKLMLSDGIEKFKEQYYQLKTTQSEMYYFGVECLEHFGFNLLERKKYNEAIEIFKFNIELFPNYEGSYEGIGDVYRALNKNYEAVKWYEKALKLNPKRIETIQKLKELKDSI